MADEVKDTNAMDPQGDQFLKMVEDVAKQTANPIVEDPKPTGDDKPEDKEPDKPEDKAPETNDPAELKRMVEGLKRELGRVRGQGRDSSEEAGQLREQIAELRGQIQTLTSKDDKPTKNAIEAATDERLIQAEMDWTDEMADARAAIREAQREGESKAADEAQRRLQAAKVSLAAIRTELRNRTDRKAAEVHTVQEGEKAISTEVQDLFEQALKAFPGLKDQSSDLWKAGNEEYMKRPNLMKALGPIGELVAVSAALVNNPELAGKGGTKARKALLSEIQDKAEDALTKGKASSPNKRPSPDFNNMDRNSMEQLISRVKSG